MANLADKSGDASSNLVQGKGTGALSFPMPGTVVLDVESVVATIDNTLGAATTATLVVRDSSGEVIATKRMGDTFPAGDTGTVTFSLRNADSGGGGIKYGIENDGSWLHITTEEAHVFGGFMVEAVTGEIRFFVDDAVNGAFRVDGPFIRLDTSGASLRLLDSGETFFQCAAGATWSFGDFALQTTAASGTGSITFDAHDAASDFTVNVGHDVAVNSARLGFFGKTPAAQQATPVTLGDVIALLRAYGLAA